MKVVTMMEKKVIKPHIGAVFPLENSLDAHNLLESRNIIGKIALEV